MDNFARFNPIIATLLATLFTYLMTAVGAASAFLFKTIDRKLLDLMLGFTGGVMLAASFWSLLAPAIEMSKGLSMPLWFPPTVGFLAGAGCLFILDRIMPHLHLFLSPDSAEGPKTHWRKTTLLVLAITLHNIPEGLAVGVAFGAASLAVPEVSSASAIALAIGLGLQNLPEGLAVSGPLRAAGLSPKHSFFLGQLSGLVEPLAGILGVLAVTRIIPILPYAMSFAAGAMIFVVVEEVVPESQQTGKSDLATIGLITGFVVMMILDVALS